MLKAFNQAEELVAIAGKIVWLDEVLTQSTRNYIFTKDVVDMTPMVKNWTVL